MANPPYGPPMVPGNPSLLERLHGLGDGLLNGLTPEQLATFDELYAGPPPQPDMTQETLAPQTGGQQFLQGFAGFENQPQGPARGFGQGLVQGLSRGLGAAGSRIEAQRAKLEAGVEQRSKERAAANQRATELYNARKSGGRQAYLMAKINADLAWGKKPTPAEIRAEAQARAEGTAAGTPPEKPKPISLDDVSKIPGLTVADVGHSLSEPSIQKRVGSTRPVAPTKPPTEFQTKATAYANLAQAAVESVFPKGHTATSVEARIATMRPSEQFGLRAPNVMQNDDQKAYNQAKYAFTLALNRQQSGANISPAEFEKVDKAYFVQPGDGLAEAKRKQKARQLAIEQLRVQANTPSANPDDEYQQYLSRSAAP